MSATTEECWQKAFKAMREQFEINNLLPEEDTPLHKFFEVKIFLQICQQATVNL